jgi:signal transduction histidine kinase
VATVAERVGAGVEGRYETHARRSDGTEFPVEVSARRLVYDGRCARVSVLRDISERRAVERVKNEFVSTVSHELRTPLTSIRGALGLIEGGVAGTVSGRGLELVRIARTNTERLVRLINTILDLEKMESGKMELGVTMLDPADVLAATLDGIGAMAEQQRVRLVARVNTFAAFAGDRDRVIQVLTNLVSNAIKFSPPDADVVVKVAVAPSGASASPSPTPAPASGRRTWTGCSRSSVSSTAPTPAAAAAPGSGSPSRARSWSSTAGRSACTP